MGRPFDGTGPKAELLRHGIIMDRAMATIFLIGQHLVRLTQGAGKDQGGGEAHGEGSMVEGGVGEVPLTQPSPPRGRGLFLS